MMNTAVAGGLGIFFWIVVARYYSPNEVGLAAAIIPIMMLIGTLSSFGFWEGLVRFLPSPGKTSRAMINSCLTISGVAAILISFLFLIGLDIWAPALLFIRKNWAFFLSFILFSVVFATYPIMNRVFVARRDARFVLAGTFINGFRILLVVIFALSFGAFGIYLSWSVALLIALVVGLLFFIPIVDPGYRPTPTVQKDVVKDMLHFSAGNYVMNILGMLAPALLPLLILNNLPAENVAYYYIAFTTAGFLFAVTDGIGTSLFAEGTHSETELRDNIRKALKFIFVLLIPGIVVAWLLGNHFLLLFGSGYSAEGVVLLRIFALSSIFIAFNSIFIVTRQVLKRIKPIIGFSAFGAIMTLGLSYVFLLWMGLIGIAIAWILSKGIVSAGIGVHLFWERWKRKNVREMSSRN